GAIVGALASIPVALALKFLTDMPWMHQMGLTALATMAIIVAVSLTTGKGQDDAKGIDLSGGLFKTSATFNISAFVVCIICAVLYALFW
ncbi:MAG TPA: sodium/glucose cotransporter, partial [Cytophagales bacterium]|nr:sodium/glucose cotransporter [Cytophagales bacterium]